MIVWRITPEQYADSVREGRGGLYAAGRWHEKGVPIIYSSENPATSLLEILVNVSKSRLATRSYSIVEIEIPDEDILEVPRDRLPEDWRALPHARSTREMGMQWLSEQATVAMSVPSAVFSLQRNILLNPLHSRFRLVKFRDPRALDLDLRLIRTATP